MKRVTYVSQLSMPISDTELEEIGAISSRNNQQDNITGVLVYFGGLFFQIIEGDETRVTQLYEKILTDARHTSVLCLKTEYDVVERLFPNWSMETINLDKSTDVLIRPVRILLNSLVESHGIIEKYTQPSILRIINAGLNPLNVQPRKVEKVVFLSDIVSFSLLSEKLPVEDITNMINQYLEVSSHILSRNGGEVTKFIGDSVLAYFAPAQADAAVQAGLEILAEIKKLRHSTQPDSVLHLLYCGIGLSKGQVVEGNFGSSVKLDYTIVGNPVNSAARIEGLTRQVKKSLVLSANVMHNLKQGWPLVELGNFALKGKKEQIEVYTLDDPLVDQFISHEQIVHRLAQMVEKPPAE